MNTTINIYVFLISVFGHLMLTTQLDIANESNKNVTIIKGTSLNSSIRQGVSKPIVIHTQIQYYDQPTLRDYQECYENLQKCKTVCEGVDNQLECVKQCPVCPLLIKEEIVVQGVNDTDYRPAATPPLNTTNIIRLTNEIHNIIENQRGNITFNNDNMVNIFQNISKVGGKFGLGYNNTDPCCIILSSSKSCNTRIFSTSARCHRKRHRVCSRKCNSRVMQAKRITVCEKGASDDENEDYLEENCYETVKYVPYHNQEPHRLRSISKCAPIPSWPYMKCGPHNVHYRQSICRLCQSLTYQYVLHRGIPAQCSGCFVTRVSPSYEIYPGFMSPNMNYGIDYEGYLDLEASDWQHDRTLCRLPNGKISENCNERDSITTETHTDIKNLLNTLNDKVQNEYVHSTNDEDHDYYDMYEQVPRKRRHLFTPSKYSRRHKLL